MAGNLSPLPPPLQVGGEEEEADLAKYRSRLAGLRYETVGFVEALILSPRMDEHCVVSSLRVIPEVGVEEQYPGKQWWRGRRVPGRQISAMNAEVLDALEVAYDIPGDNVLIRGINLAEFKPGDTLRVGEAVLVATATPHRPCAKFARRTSAIKLKAITQGRLRGTLFAALHPATIYVGDSVERIILP